MTYNQFGDAVESEADDEAPEPHDPRCRKGWIDRDADNPVPCLKCKPNLAPEIRRRNLGLGEQK